MRVRFSGVALRRIDAILAHVHPRSPQGAARIAARIEEVAGLIEAHPHAGQETDRSGVRRIVLSPFPYVLFYRVMAGVVIVTDVRHAARKS